jgi:hypothetical protein
MGKLVLGENTLQTSGTLSIDMPFQVQHNGSYEFWIRMGFGPSQGTIAISVDGSSVKDVGAYQDLDSMNWLDVATLDLKQGSHSIKIENKGDGFCDIDVIAIVESSMLESEHESIMSLIQQFSGRIIYFLQAEDLFAHNLPSGWSSVVYPYNGIALYTEGIGNNISPEGTAFASSTYPTSSSPNLFGAEHAIDANTSTRWASEGGMPQWLEVDWSDPQKIAGTKISFENALAEDYSIQTWNGTQWISQVVVTGNNELDRVDSFQQTVTTTKLRIYVTKAPAYDIVSIWELECFSQGFTSNPSADFYLSDSRSYMVGLRLASGSNSGSLTLNIDNFSANVSCSSNSSGFNWYEVGPYQLAEGTHTISASASGRAALDSIMLYSLLDNEKTSSVTDLFGQDNAPASISYKMIDPCTYDIHARSDASFFLVFSETYHPSWKIYMNGLEFPHVAAYSFLNTYFVNETGEFDLVLYFEGQTYANVGVEISAITFVAIVIYLTFRSVPFKKFFRQLRNYLQKPTV